MKSSLMKRVRSLAPVQAFAFSMFFVTPLQLLADESSQPTVPAAPAAKQTPAKRARFWWQSTTYQAQPERFRPEGGNIVETILAGGEHVDQSYQRRYSPKPVAAPFGTFGMVDFSGSRLRSLGQSFGVMYSGTEYPLPQDSEATSICGPAAHNDASNELVCLSQSTGEILDRLPLPGELSAAPLFHNGSWILATTKGFLFRTAGLSDRGTPVLGSTNASFWGAESRARMSHLRNTYRKASSGDQAAGASPASGSSSSLEYVQPGWTWFHWSSAAFTTPLLIQGTRIIALTANQFVYSIEFETGKIAWAQRIGTNEDLQIQSRSLAVSSRFVIAGTADGGLQFLSPANGKVEFQVEIPKGTRNRFVGVVAQPLVAGQRIVASNASSSTVMVNERTQRAEWSLPFGSIASPQRSGERVFLGTMEGKILKVDIQTGKILMERQIAFGEPIASLAIVKAEENETLMVAQRNGIIRSLNTADLSEGQQFLSQGVIMGEFIRAETSESVCISTNLGMIRCFAAFKGG
jgi:outer membrane protein assembly factor BamB